MLQQLPTLTDLRGTPIAIGSKVAFNYSGNVGCGYVRAIKSRLSYGGTRYSFEIEREYPAPKPGANTISKVGNQYNLLVLFE